MAHYLLRFLQQDMLLLWDRNFLSYRTVAEVRRRRAHLLARIKSNLIFEPIRALGDGSYLAKLYRVRTTGGRTATASWCGSSSTPSMTPADPARGAASAADDAAG